MSAKLGRPADEWCWMERDGERCHGPFESRAAAIEDARDRGADLSPCVGYRYRLWRRWG